MKYILVTGGVISGIGKGVIASSIGALLKAVGLRVTSIKIDPYINIDAGTFSPFEHGEVFVLDDGGEVDLDLGNYERFLDVTLHSDNNITTGKIYQKVISDERAGRYLGRTVQVVPHITDAIQEWVQRVAHKPVDAACGDSDGLPPEVAIIELGGTIGDIEGMPFVEAFRQFQFRVGRDNFCCVHVSLVPQPASTGEQKSKPTQASVRELRGLGLYPDIIACRSEKPIAADVKNKISNFCHVHRQQVLCLHDAQSLYSVPGMLADEGCLQALCGRLQLTTVSHTGRALRRCLQPWRQLADRQANVRTSVAIALVGKYTKLQDSYASVIKALQHAALAVGRRLQLHCIDAEHLETAGSERTVEHYDAWRRLVQCRGLLVPGGFGSRGAAGKMAAIQWARSNHVPYLGVCLGMQLAVVEFARSRLKLVTADSAEFSGDTVDPVVIEMPEHNPGQMGGTMRLGRRATRFLSPEGTAESPTPPSVVQQLYSGAEVIHERHRHRYEVNPAYVECLQKEGMRFVGQAEEGRGGTRMEILELAGHPYFVGVQFHPEYMTRPNRPSPPYLGLLLAASDKLRQFLSRGCRTQALGDMSTPPIYSSDEDEDGQVQDMERLHIGASETASAAVKSEPPVSGQSTLVPDD